MDLNPLAQAMAPRVTLEQLQALYATFRASSPGGGEYAFVTWLYTNKHIGTRTFANGLSRLAVRPKATGEAKQLKVLAVVGKGAQGEVLAVQDTALGRTVAVKRMTKDGLSDTRAVDRFYTEARITAQLSHPSIVPVYSLDDSSGLPTYQMQLINGLTLEELIEQAKQIHDAGFKPGDQHNLPARLEHFLKVCDAISYAHARNIVHRDLKPENIMIGPFREVYVMDWGIAKTPGTVTEDQEGAFGTPGYMSPEQASGQNHTLDAKSDQASLGIILFELVSLRRAYPGDGLEAVIACSEGKKQPLVHYGKKGVIPKDLAAIIDRATALDPKDRYPDVEALADDVRLYQQGEPPLARPDNFWRSTLRLWRAYSQVTLFAMMAVMLGAAFISLAAVAAVGVQQHYASEREEKLTRVLTSVSDQSSRADATLLHFEGLLSGLAGAAEQSLMWANPPRQVFFHGKDYDDREFRPDDTLASRDHKQDVSFGWTSIKLAPDVEERDVRYQIDQLVLLREPLRRLVLRSRRDDSLSLRRDEATALLAEEGAPLIWSFVGTELGVHMSYPGHGGYDPAYDPRMRSWYALGKDSRVPVWGRAYADANGLGLIVPCVVSVRDNADRLLGVAGIEVTIDHLIDELLTNPDLPQADQIYLVDREGGVVVSSTQKGSTSRATRRRDLPHEAALAEIKAGRSGYTEEGDTLVVFSKMQSLGWYIVLTGPKSKLL